MATHDVAPGAAGGIEGPDDESLGGDTDLLAAILADPTDAAEPSAPTGPVERTGPGVDDGHDRVTSWLLVAAAAVGLILLVTLVVKVMTWDWIAVGDYGTIRLHTLDVGTSHTPLLGVYSRWGWNHPGPLLFYVLAPFLRLSGGDGHGLLLGALVANTAAVVGTLWVAARAGRRWLALTAVVLALLICGLDTAGLIDPWNPYTLIVPLFAAAIAAWRAALGDRVAAVVLMVAGSFAVQSHVLAGPPVAVLLGVGVVGLGLRCWRGPDRRHDRFTALIAVGVGLVLWIPPIIEQFTHSPGNLGQIIDFALHGDETPVGWAVGARVVGRALSLPPTWITGGLSSELRPIPWALFGLLAATLWAWRRRWTSELVLCVTTLLLTLAAFVGSARVTGVAFPYLFRWVWVVGALAWLCIVAVVVAELRSRWTWARFAPAALAGGTIVVLLVLVVRGPDLTDLKRVDAPLRAVSSVIDPTMDALREAPGPVVMTPTAFGIDSSLGIELLGRTADAGLDVGFPSDLGYVFGAHRTVDPALAQRELVLASGPARATYAADPNYVVVAEFAPLTPEEWAEFDQLNAIDWGSRPDGATNPGPEYRRYQELSDKAYTALTVFLSVGRPSSNPG